MDYSRDSEYVIPMLVAGIQESAYDTEAMESLGKFGSAAKVAIPSLEKVMQEKMSMRQDLPACFGELFEPFLREKRMAAKEALSRIR